jgi:hypothetical protein
MFLCLVAIGCGTVRRIQKDFANIFPPPEEVILLPGSATGGKQVTFSVEIPLRRGRSVKQLLWDFGLGADPQFTVSEKENTTATVTVPNPEVTEPQKTLMVWVLTDHAEEMEYELTYTLVRDTTPVPSPPATP